MRWAPSGARLFRAHFRAHVGEPESIELTFASASKTSFSASSLRKHHTGGPYILWLDKGRSPGKDAGLSGRVLGSGKEVNVASLALHLQPSILVNGRQHLRNDTKRNKGRRRIQVLSVLLEE